MARERITILSDIAKIAAGFGILALAAATTRSNRGREKFRGASSLDEVLRKRKPRRKPPEAGIAVSAVPPGGPRPKQGGAEAPLDFDS